MRWGRYRGNHFGLGKGGGGRLDLGCAMGLRGWSNGRLHRGGSSGYCS